MPDSAPLPPPLAVTPVTLEGVHVRLEPLRRDHLDALCAAGLKPEIWQWSPDPIRSRGDMARYVEAALAAQAAGTALPFATLHRPTGRVVGCTRYGNIEPAHRRVEIGWTWIAPAWQRTAINTEAKLLMLRHAFEHWRCLRVELKTDVLNSRSRRAILRLGAREEGILRKHVVTATGRVRDTVYYSILHDEWPVVRAALEQKLWQQRT